MQQLPKKLNVRFLGCLLAVLALLSVGVHFLHGYQVRRNAGALLHQADRAAEGGDLEKAAESLARYLAFVPVDTEALAKYGLLLADDTMATTPRGRLRAFLPLEQVLRREPERTEVRRRLVHVAMKLGRFIDAQQHLEVLLTAAANDAELEDLLGQCEEANGRYGKADEWYARALSHAPGRVEYYVRRAHLLRHRLEAAKAADEVMDELVGRNGESFQARLARARYLKERGAMEGAAADVAYALEKLAPDDADVLLAAADLAAGRDDGPAAEKYLDRGISLHPRDVRLYHARAHLDLRAGRAPEALGWLRQALKVLSNDPDLAWKTAGLLIEAGEMPAAQDLILRLRRLGWSAPLLDYLEARILVHERKWRAASQVLERVRSLLSWTPQLARQADLDLGQCYDRLGNPDLQMAAYRRAVAAEPAWVPARLGLAGALYAMGRIDEALEEYRPVMSRAPGGRVVVAQLLILRNLRLPTGQRRWDEVARLLDDAERAAPEAIEPSLLRAEVLVAQGRHEDARRGLDAARAKQPKKVAFAVALATLADRLGNGADGLRLLDEAERDLGDGPELRLARVRYWSKRRGPEARKALAALEQKAGDLAGPEQAQLLRELGDAYYLLGDAAGAERSWGSLAALQPDNLHVRLLLFDLALQAGKEDELRRRLTEIREIEGEGGALGHYGEAARSLLLAKRGDKEKWLGEARLRLADVGRQRPAWARVALLEADLEELEGNPERAAECYQRAIDLGDRQPAVIRRLIHLFYERQRYQEAEQVVRKLLEQPHVPVAGDLGRIAAEIAIRNRHHERALELASQVVSADSRDFRDHVWLGQILWAVGKQGPAEAALRRAVALAEKNPDPWVALINQLARMGRKAEAEAALEKARGRIAADQAPLALAQCYEAVGHRDRAEEQYRAALKTRPEAVPVLRGVSDFYLRSGQFESAEPLLRRLADARTKARPGDVSWARRNLAVGLAVGGSYRRFQEALALLEANVPGGAAVEDQRAKALVLGTQPGRRREAIRLFEDVLRRQPPTADEQFLLARLHEANRDWPKARDLLLSLVTAPELVKADHLAHYARGLIHRGETHDAVQWLARLDKLEPDAWRTVELRARLLRAQAKDVEAAALLRKWAIDRSGDIGRAATLLDDLGHADAAEELYRQWIAQPKQPLAALALAAHLGRAKRLDEAIVLCEAAWKTCPPEAVAATSVAMLRAGQAGGGACRRVEQQLRQAIDQSPQSAAVLVSLAELHDYQGRYAEAEVLYRQLLRRDGNNVVALNNLAWLLALKFEKAAEGLELIDRAIEAAGPAPELLDTRATVQLILGRGDAARKDLEQALAERPTAGMYFHLAQAQHLVRNPTGAADALRRAGRTGLTTASLHPLERPAYDRLVRDLDRK